MVQGFLKSASVVVGLLASVFLGIPLAGFGLTGLAGRLADADYATNFYGGLQLLGMAAGIWIAFFACLLAVVDGATS
jgi:small-conductance mechanosensitive channel